MVELRPLIIITGSVHVSGGDTSTVRKRGKTEAHAQTIVINREVTEDRRAANVIATDYMRKLRNLRLLWTPYGVLVNPAELAEIRGLLAHVDHRIAAYHQARKRTCELQNCVIWENLKGNRLNRVTGWIEAQIARGSAEVKEALPKLVPTIAAA